jgi:hypothetical protein
MAKVNRLPIALALLAAALPVLAGRAAAEEIALKCSYSLWDHVRVGNYEIAGGFRKDDLNTPNVESFRARLAQVPMQTTFDRIDVIDLGGSGNRKGIEVHPDHIHIGRGNEQDNDFRPLFPGREYRSGFYIFGFQRIKRVDLSASAHFYVYFGLDGGPASLERLPWGNVSALVEVKGSCTRVPKML